MPLLPSGSSTRRALHAYVSDDAHNRWHDFAAENGVSVSALLEVLGTRLLAGTENSTPDDGPEAAAETESGSELQQMITEARVLDTMRRRRNRQGGQGRSTADAEG